jgi:hypothetical protein
MMKKFTWHQRSANNAERRSSERQVQLSRQENHRAFTQKELLRERLKF